LDIILHNSKLHQSEAKEHHKAGLPQPATCLRPSLLPPDAPLALSRRIGFIGCKTIGIHHWLQNDLAAKQLDSVALIGRGWTEGTFSDKTDSWIISLMKKIGCRCSLEPTRCQQLPQPVVQSRAITLPLPVTGILPPRPCFHHVRPNPPVAYLRKAESNSLSVGHHGPVPRRVRARPSQNWLSTVFVATDTWNYPPVIKGGNGRLRKIYITSIIMYRRFSH
jgi:hypothetical protein